MSGAHWLRSTGQFSDLDPDLPPHVAYAGNEHLILNVTSRARLADLDYDVPQLEQLMRHHGLTTVHLSWQEGPQVFHARNPFPVGGVYEDAATGAAAAAFGAYLQAIDPATERAFTIHQGEDMGRPSTLRVHVSQEREGAAVTGTAVPIEQHD